MLADIADYAKWLGEAPFAELRNLDPELAKVLAPWLKGLEGALEGRMTTVHYWGQFSERLPAPFTEDGGHRFIAHATEAEARATLIALRDALKASFPGVDITEEGDEMHFLLETDEEMWAELAPRSDYATSWQAHEDDTCWVHTFGGGASGLFWDLGGDGVVDVGTSPDGAEVVLVRSWVDDDVDEEQVRAYIDAPSERESPVAELSIKSGKAVVVWSRAAPFMLDDIEGPDALAALDAGTDLDTEGSGGVGTVIHMKPGRWTVTVASTEDDPDDEKRSWSCRWCRLTWQG